MLSPDYYSSFRCKINRCRVACCNGWPVTFSMQDYFRLLSLNWTGMENLSGFRDHMLTSLLLCSGYVRLLVL